jgi:hypothetical protein
MRLAPRNGKVLPSVGAMARPVLQWRALECPQVLVLFGLILAKAFQPLGATINIEPSQRYRLPAGVDAIHGLVVGNKPRIAAEAIRF